MQRAVRASSRGTSPSEARQCGLFRKMGSARQAGRQQILGQPQCCSWGPSYSFALYGLMLTLWLAILSLGAPKGPRLFDSIGRPLESLSSGPSILPPTLP